jgi:hypothetical protein
VKRFSELLMSGELLANEMDIAPKETESQTQVTNRIQDQRSKELK